ncbi:uncharacterized protein LOC130967495 [Arachis stenosperma]|uniref:uncharacterized protein n=1 Tax=Arachis hypogaea TaxID=3818 RepID=UPI000DEC9C3C|nr:uncharacterized protein LOC112735037 [Arachis hypogaea]XP_025691949.1 uncharacterized protein LOC112792789 [Arachis hypogaea]XP_057748358.1 uncharacterized protein LOC130967495 [Arachis stenosperma]QHO04352.1 uncharacterized protein DS421_13g439680 [Arachis hypogaea]
MLKRRGCPKGSSAQKKIKESADSGLEILDNLPNVLKVESISGDVQDAEFYVSDTSMPKKRGRGRPKGSGVQNHEESIHSNLNSQNISSALGDVGRRCEESGQSGMPEKRGRGRPKGSKVQKCQVVQRNSNFDHVPLNMVGVSSRGEELEEAGPEDPTTRKNHKQNADGVSINPKRKGRGPTKGLILEMKRQQSADGKLDVLIHPTKLVAVGPGRKDFITDLSLIVRKHARLNVHMWRKVPKSTRDTIVQSILNNWRLQDTDMVRKAILDEAGRLYRNWRNRLHDYYLVFETKEEALKHVPNDVNPSDWQFMVDYFSSPSFKLISTVNKTNRTKMQTNHTSGQKSFHAVSYEARDPVTGKEPHLQKLWQLTHKKTNGEWVDEASKEVNDKIAEQIDKNLRELEDSQEGIETVEPEIINNAFESVVRNKTCVLGSGGGPQSSKSNTVQQLLAELEAQKRETENARKECNETRAKLVEVESQLDEERRKREEIEARLLNRQKEMQEINSQVQTAIQSAFMRYHPPTNEEETSAKQNSLIAELEAQLVEAEDVISDLRSELDRRSRR